VTRARRRGARLTVVASVGLASVVALAVGQEAHGDDRAVVILEVQGSSLGRLLQIPELRGLAATGGVGLLAGGYDGLGVGGMLGVSLIAGPGKMGTP
jgi:hypothetical protein